MFLCVHAEDFNRTRALAHKQFSQMYCNRYKDVCGDSKDVKFVLISQHKQAETPLAGTNYLGVRQLFQ